MHSDVRDVTLISNSLRAIEQICKFARISLELQDQKLFENACNELLGLLKEPPYYQPGFEISVLACLELIKDNTLPHQVDLALKVADRVADSVQLLPEQEELLKAWCQHLRAIKSPSQSIEREAAANTLDYMLHVEHALGPIKLLARKTTTHWPFFIGANTFSRLHTNMEPANPPSSALLLVLSIWTAGSDPSRTHWPSNLSVMLNGVTLSSVVKQYVAKSKRSTINFTINGEGNMDITHLVVKGKNILLVRRGTKETEDLNLSIEMYAVETQAMASENIRKNVLPGHVWRNVLNRLLGNKSTVSESSPKRKSGSLVPKADIHSPEQADLLSISQTSLRISARCPITLKMICNPVRGVDCKHYDCFELESYLLVNRGMAQWKCPHCNKYTPPSKLVFDSYLEEIFANIPNHASEIEFRKDSQTGERIRYEVISDSVTDDHFSTLNKSHQASLNQGLDTTTLEPCKSITIVEID